MTQGRRFVEPWLQISGLACDSGFRPTLFDAQCDACGLLHQKAWGEVVQAIVCQGKLLSMLDHQAS